MFLHQKSDTTNRDYSCNHCRNWNHITGIRDILERNFFIIAGNSILWKVGQWNILIVDCGGWNWCFIDDGWCIIIFVTAAARTWGWIFWVNRWVYRFAVTDCVAYGWFLEIFCNTRIMISIYWVKNSFFIGV